LRFDAGLFRSTASEIMTVALAPLVLRILLTRAGGHSVIHGGIFSSGQRPSISRKLHSGAASAIRPGKPRRPLILADSRRRGLDFSLLP